MGYLLSGAYDGDMMGDELGGYVGDDLSGYVGEGLLGADHHHHGRHRNDRSQLMLQPLPVPETAFTASQTQDISTFPQRAFRPLRLVVPSTLGPLFKLNDIKVGQETQLVASGTIYGEVMSEVAVGVMLKGTLARLGNNIVINVTNRDANNAQTFSATFLGNTETT